MVLLWVLLFFSFVWGWNGMICNGMMWVKFGNGNGNGNGFCDWDG